MLAEFLDRDQIEQAYQRLRAEWKPTSATATFFLREMARHQVTLQRIESMEVSVLRRGAQGALNLFHTDPDQAEDSVVDTWDAALAGAATAEAVEKISRYRRLHERAYLRSFQALQTLQKQGAGTFPAACKSATAAPSPRFASEADCVAYLHARFTAGKIPCPGCGDTAGHWVASRKVWQCQSCRRQSSLRRGTVMAGSRLGLWPWFQAIRTLIENPNASEDELADATGIRRPGTLQKLKKKIQAAKKSPEATALLAGLDRLPGP